MNNNITECCGNCNSCQLDKCPIDSYPLTPEEYNLARTLDKEVLEEREEKPISMDRYVSNRPDKEAYERERDRQLEHARYWRDPDKHRENARNRYYRNRDHALDRAKAYYKDNSEEIKTKRMAYYNTNKEEISEKKRNKRKEMKELWKTVERQTFRMDDGTELELLVVTQKSINFISTTWLIL